MRRLLAIWRPLVILAFAVLAAIFVNQWFWIGAAVMALDARARGADYRRYRGARGTQRLLLELGKSWCGRGVAIAIWPWSRGVFQLYGYRWWHIFPDGAPSVFFNLPFWRSVVGVRSARPAIP